MMNQWQIQFKSNPNNLQNLEESKEKQKVKDKLKAKREEKGDGTVKVGKGGGLETEAEETGPEVETGGGQGLEKGDDQDLVIDVGPILSDVIIIQGAETDAREALKGQGETAQEDGKVEWMKALKIKGSSVPGRKLRSILSHQDLCLIKEMHHMVM